MSTPERLTQRFGPVSAVDLALFAAASGDHNPLHLDADVARAAGFERPVVHGMLTMAYAARLFAQAFGAGRVLSLQTRFVGAALLGDTIEYTAMLTQMADGAAHFDLQARTLRGTELVTGSARIAIP
jgi:acyl dehydratase